MSEDKDPYVSGIEIHEEFMQHIERGGGIIKTLAVITILVSGALAVSYVSQLVILPFALGITSQTVNLVDPSLMATEVALLTLTLIWFYVGLRDYRFVRKMARQVREIRVLEAQAAKKYGLDS